MELLNIPDVIAQTLSFTIAFTWRESIRDAIKHCLPEHWITGPIGTLIYASIVTIIIILIVVIFEYIKNHSIKMRNTEKNEVHITHNDFKNK